MKKRLQWKYLFTGCKTSFPIWRPFWIHNGRLYTKILRVGQNLVSNWILLLRIDIRHRFWNFQSGRQYKNLKNQNKLLKNQKWRLQWKYLFTGCKTCCSIWRPIWIHNGRLYTEILRVGQNLASNLILLLQIDICHRFWKYQNGHL